jgi:DNA-binding NarL/FixJ family response regulator
VRSNASRALARGGFVAQPCATVHEAQVAFALDLVAIVVHLGLKDADPVAFVRAVSKRKSSLPVLALCPRGDDERVVATVRGGARGCLYVDDIDARLSPALEEILGGGRPMSRGMAGLFLETVRRTRVSSQQQQAVRPLTPRERAVLSELGRGATYELVAENLGVSVNTVRTFVRSIYEKLGVDSRVDAVLLGIRLGLIKGTPFPASKAR